MTEETFIIVRARVIDNELGEVEVLDTGGHELPGHDGLVLPDINEFENGTILTITYKPMGNGLEAISFEETNEIPTNVDVPENSDPFNGWIKVGTEWFSPEDLEILNTAKAIAEQNLALHVLAIGESGYGKTSRGKAFAAAHDLSYTRIDVSLFREPEEMFFWRDAQGTGKGETETVSRPTEFTNTLRAGNALVQLDELNRAEPWVLDPLFPILDYERRTVLRDKIIEVGDNVLFVATINEGYQFVGTFGLDQALRNRFAAKMLVGPPPTAVEIEIVKEKCDLDEETAEKIVRVLHMLRHSNEEAFQAISMSTRTALQVGLLHRGGMNLLRAFTAVIINDCPPTSSRQITDIINSELRR